MIFMVFFAYYSIFFCILNCVFCGCSMHSVERRRRVRHDVDG